MPLSTFLKIEYSPIKNDTKALAASWIFFFILFALLSPVSNLPVFSLLVSVTLPVLFSTFSLFDPFAHTPLLALQPVSESGNISKCDFPAYANTSKQLREVQGCNTSRYTTQTGWFASHPPMPTFNSSPLSLPGHSITGMCKLKKNQPPLTVEKERVYQAETFTFTYFHKEINSAELKVFI